jgi:hypothetical protein
MLKKKMKEGNGEEEQRKTNSLKKETESTKKTVRER